MECRHALCHEQAVPNQVWCLVHLEEAAKPMEGIFKILRNPEPTSTPFAAFRKTPCENCKAECCYHVPVHKDDVNRCLQFLLTLDAEYVFKLTQMQRPEGMCPFVDVETWRCAVHPVRPEICKRFGYEPKLRCTHAPELASTNPDGSYEVYVRNKMNEQENVTIMGDLFGWSDVDLKFEED